MLRNTPVILGAVVFLFAVALPEGGAKNACATPSSRQALAPRVVSAAVPTYPVVAVEARITGTVRMRLTVRGGRIVGIRELGSAPPMLVAATKQNVETWRFSKGVNKTIETSFVFQISSQETEKEESPHIVLDLPSFVLLRARRLKLKPTTLYGHQASND
jgi:Gram-negative bacterial TonB protein C-terminal